MNNAEGSHFANAPGKRAGKTLDHETPPCSKVAETLLETSHFDGKRGYGQNLT